jgi:malonyl-CoA decarboxylase
VSFGDSLIKHVVETLTQEFPSSSSSPRCRPFRDCAAGWSKNGDAALAELDDKQKAALEKVAGGVSAAQLLAALDDPGSLPEKSVVRQAAMFAPRAIWVGEMPRGVRWMPWHAFTLATVRAWSA